MADRKRWGRRRRPHLYADVSTRPRSYEARVAQWSEWHASGRLTISRPGSRASHGDLRSNLRVNASVRPVTPLANGASVAPVRPARYAGR